MVERQPPWDKYEAAMLLEGLLASMKGELTRSDAIKSVSRDLRIMAFHRGMEVNEVYRNTNGISLQMKSMESAYLGYTVFKPATKLFADIAGLYHNSYDEYQKLLKEAKAMIYNKKAVEDDFMRYLAERVSPAQLSELYGCYSEIEAFCLKIIRKVIIPSKGHDLVSHLVVTDAASYGCHRPATLMAQKKRKLRRLAELRRLGRKEASVKALIRSADPHHMVLYDNIVLSAFQFPLDQLDIIGFIEPGCSCDKFFHL